MNHIYKVIWSRVKNSYVVVTEIPVNKKAAKTAASVFLETLTLPLFLAVPAISETTT